MEINSFINPNLGLSFGPYWNYSPGAGLAYYFYSYTITNAYVSFLMILRIEVS